MRVIPLRNRTTEPALTAEALSECYLTPIYRYVYRRLARDQKSDADDITAQAFQAALRGAHRLKPGTDPYLWLLGVARRELVNHARRQRYRKMEALDEATLISSETPEVAALDQERRTELWRILDSLAPDQREALLLQHLEDLSVAQIAQVLSKSHAATNSLLQRARQRALQLGGAYFFAEDETK